MSGKLILVRGLPGSGKSRLAKSLVCHPYHWEADMFFCRTFDQFGNEDGYLGEYKFDATKLAVAHAWCLKMTAEFMEEGRTVVVSNTFSELWEGMPYMELAESRGWDLTVIRCLGRYKSIHDVPEKAIEKMRLRWQDYPKEITSYPFITKEIK